MSIRLIDLVNINKNFDDELILNNVNLYIRKNEFITLLGPSGCGKTTTLRIIGGFESPSSGDVLFEGKSMIHLPPYKRRVNTVFQKYALFPNMNVEENIAFGLRIKKMNEKLIKEKVASMLKLVNLKGYEKRDITSLSGGQQQRIAIARALVNEPEVLLLDEPLGALDLKLRKDMQIELKNMQQKLGITFIFVTHDQEEALSMSDTIVVMNGGVIQQIGTPQDIYNEPKNAFVAEFIGESNIVDGVMRSPAVVSYLNHTFDTNEKNLSTDEMVDIIIRPEDIKIVSKDTGVLNGIVKNVTFKGVHYEMLVHADDSIWKIQNTKMAPVGETIGLSFASEDIHTMKKVDNK